MTDILKQAKECLKVFEDAAKNDDKIKSIAKRGIHVEKEIPESCILFLGMNPSFREGDREHLDDCTYTLDGPGIREHSFFKKSIEIADQLQLSYGHHDLFPIRERNQKIIEGLFCQGDQLYPRKEFEQFIDKCKRWTEETIKAANPEVIVVANAFASKVFLDLKYFDGVTYDPTLGADFICVCGRYIPILFSGMLTGQRALDIFSCNRLIWHIGFLLENKGEWPIHCSE